MPPDAGDGSAEAGDAATGEGLGSAGRAARTARVMGTRRYRQLRRRLGEIPARADRPVAPALARAAAGDDVADLFEYPRKSTPLAYVLWLLAGFLGAHRFYLDREGTAGAQFLTGGGLMIWWAVDAFLLPSMVREYNRDQAEREESGRPPRSLAFLDAWDDEDAGGEPGPAADEPEPADAHGARGGRGAGAPAAAAGGGSVPEWADDRAAGWWRLAADLAVVGFAGMTLGVVSVASGGWRGAAAVATVVLAIGFAPELSALRRVPGIGDLLRWTGRLSLFYRRHDPGGPLSRLVRPMVGVLYAPFRKRARAEARLYVELGGAFAIVFFWVDVAVVVASALAGEEGLLDLASVIQMSTAWASAAALTMVNVYAFASPVGATLFEHALAGRTHRRVWLLGGTALLGLAAGLVAELAAP